MNREQLPRLYTDLASWFHLLTAPSDYAEEASTYWEMLVGACGRPPRTMLELGSGGGNNASHLKAHTQLTLVDLSPAMLDISRAINPECEHIQGDMRWVRIGRIFDAVFVHDAVMYLTTEADLHSLFETAYLHCAPGGAVLVVPDCVRETFRQGTNHGGHDGDGRSLRYLEWTWDPDPADSTYTVDFAYLLRERDGSVQALQDRHTFGLFSHSTWLDLMTAAGFEASVAPFVHSQVDAGLTEMFIGRRPSL